MNYKKISLLILAFAMCMLSAIGANAAAQSYKEDFASPSAMENIAVYGNASVENGALALNGNGAIAESVYAVLPFASQGDFVFSADFDVYGLDGFNTVGVIIGMNNDGEHYRVLFSAHSVEVVYTTGGASWQTVMRSETEIDEDEDGKTAFSAIIAVNKNNLYVCIGERIVLQCALSNSTEGSVGVEAYGTLAYVDNVAVKEEKYSGKTLSSSYTEDIYVLQTGIKNPPTVISYDDGISDAYKADSPRPSVLIYRVVSENGKLLVNANGQVKQTLDERYKLNKGRVVPAFCISDEEGARLLSKWLVDNSVNDGFVISSKGDYISTAIGNNPYLRGCIDATSSININADELYEKARNAKCNTVILSGRTSEKTVFSLQSRLITVFSECVSANTLGIYDCLQSGCNGIVGNAQEIIAYMEGIKTPTVFRTPVICTIGGDTAAAPKNTLAAISSAFDSGASAVQVDVCITDDGVPVLSDTDETVYLNKTVSIFNTTIEELQKLKYTDERVNGQTINTLEELLLMIKNDYPDASVRVRLADERRLTASAVESTAVDASMVQRVMIVSPSYELVDYINENLQIKANSLYTPYSTSNNTVSERVCYLEGYLRVQNSAYIGNKGVIPASLLAHVSARGLGIYPGGVNNNEAEAYFSAAYNGFSVYEISAFSNIPVKLAVQTDENGKLSVFSQAYDGTLLNVTDKAQFISFDGVTAYDGNTVNGDGEFAFSYEATLSSGSKYTVYSESISNKKDDPPAAPAPNVPQKDDGFMSDAFEYAAIGIGALTIIGGLLLFYLLRRKNKGDKKE